MVSERMYPPCDGTSDGDCLRTVLMPRSSVTSGSRPFNVRSASRKNSQSRSTPSRLCLTMKSFTRFAKIAFDLLPDDVAFDSNENVLSAGRMLTRTLRCGFFCLRDAKNFKSPAMRRGEREKLNQMTDEWCG